MKLFLLILITPFLSGNEMGQTKDELSDLLIGTWVHQQSGDKHSLRYVKASELKENQRGFIFREDGTVVIYREFGCQMPYPNFRKSNADWNVRSAKTVLIDRHYPGQSPDKMRIVKISNRVLRFTWD